MKNHLTRLVNMMCSARLRSTPVRLLAFLPLLAVTMAAGPCGKEPLGSLDGGTSCTYEGKVYRAASSFPTLDGCNTCTCSSDGLVACTHKTCSDGGTDGQFDGGNVCPDPVTGQVVPCPDGGTISDGGATSDGPPLCLDAKGMPIPCTGDGGVTMCVYQGKTFPVGASFPAADNCNRCTCGADGRVSCGTGTCVDGGTDGATSCTYGGQVYGVGATFPAGDGCNTCSCSMGGVVACTLIACQDAGPTKDGGTITGVCTPGQDQTCNEDPYVSALRGKCRSDGSCLCNGSGTSGVVSPYTGKCLAPENLTGNACERYKTFPVGSTFPCSDSQCNTCFCASPGSIIVFDDKSSCADGGAPQCGLDAVYIYGDIGGLRVSQDQVTIAPSPTSPRDQATYVRTRNNIDGAAGISCNPPFPACGDTASIDVSDIMADVQDPMVQKYLTSNPGKPLFVGFDTRPIDGTAFSFMRGDGHGFLVGQACGTSSSASSCVPIPPTIDKLVKDLRALDDQQLRSASCAALR